MATAVVASRNDAEFPPHVTATGTVFFVNGVHVAEVDVTAGCLRAWDAFPN